MPQIIPQNSQEGKTTANYISESNLSNTFYPETANSLSTNIHCESFSMAFHKQRQAISSEAQEIIKSKKYNDNLEPLPLSLLKRNVI